MSYDLTIIRKTRRSINFIYFIYYFLFSNTYIILLQPQNDYRLIL
jgi:hypothetical protein